MSSPDSPSSIALTQSQQILRRKLKEDMAKSLNRRPVGAQDHYAQYAANSGDWTILEQPSRQLPLSLCQLISLELRDHGNTLFEETRALNNRFAGCSFRAAEVMLSSDSEFLDLHRRALTWGEEVASQVNFKLRHQARDDPYRAFTGAFDSFISQIDTVMAHGSDRLHQMVWAAVLDLLPYKLFEAMLIKPGHCRLSHEATKAHLPHVKLSESVQTARAQELLTRILSLYGVEPMVYIDTVVLTPLLAVLQQDTALPLPNTHSMRYHQMFADLLEAHPYLVSSDRAERYMFYIPGTTCVATFSFLAANGCAKIMFWDDVESLRLGLHSNFVRGCLHIGYDGGISCWMHPWRTLDKVFGPDCAATLAFWLLKQVHGLLVQDYLSIEKYYLHPSDEKTEASVAFSVPDEALLFVALAKAAEGEEDPESETQPEVLPVDAVHGDGTLPQLRRRYFFKLLGRCGVSIEQGKGSEIKLLRKTKRPFRLGNHYGSNPTIPAFLATNILKRLEITRDEWFDAITAN